MKTKDSKLDSSIASGASEQRIAAKPLVFPDASGDVACVISHSTPIDQPEQVHQLTPVLFAQYEVDNGSVSLGGCLLEDIPFIRIESTSTKPIDPAPKESSPKESMPNESTPSADDRALSLSSHAAHSAHASARVKVTVEVFNQSGLEVAPEIAHVMGLDYPKPIDTPPAHVNPNDVGKWLQPLLERLQQRLEMDDRQATKCEIVWCKRAEGKIAISIDDESINIPFSGWARELANGVTPAPIFACPRTGRRSYHVTLSEKGEITVPDAIKTCAVTGKRVLETELERCESSDRLCLPEYLSNSEASGKRVIAERLMECSQCGQQVCPEEMSQKRCITCQKIGARPVDSNRITALQQAMPGLSRWTGWQSSESESCEVFRAYGWVKTLLICIDKTTGKPRRVMLGSRLNNTLEIIAPEEWPAILEAE